MAKRVSKKAAAKKQAGKRKKTKPAKKKASSAKGSASKSTTKSTVKKKTTKKASTKKRVAKKKAVKSSSSGSARKKASPKKTTTTKKATRKKTTEKTTKSNEPRKVSRLTESEAPSAEEPKKVKSPLKKRELESFRQLLLAKRAMLTNDVTTMTDTALRGSSYSDAGELSTMPIHMADLGSDNFEQEFTLGLIQNEHAVLREIDEALQRIDEGTYGICLGTGKPIAKARLRAKPWAKYCIEYARKLERGF